MNRNPRIRPVVVCLHGSAGNSHMWCAFVDMVRNRCEVLTPAMDFSAGGVHEAADQVLARIGRTPRQFHVVGHAYGGAVALELARRVPERVLSLVLYEPAAPPPGVLPANREMPVRLLCGTRSWPAARHVVHRLRAQIANASLLQLVGLRHMAPLTHPDRINPVIVDHILPEAIPETRGLATEGRS